jgi:excisionase family DNA binding protein
MTSQIIGVKTMEVQLLKMKEVADRLGVSVSFAYILTKRGDLPTVRLGTAVRVRAEDLERYVKEKATLNEQPSNFSPR